MKRPLPLRLFVTAALVAGGVQLLAPASEAGGPSHKMFSEAISAQTTQVTGTTSLSSLDYTTTTVNIDPGTYYFYVRITNSSTGSQAVPFGSFQVTVPAGFTGIRAALPTGQGYDNFSVVGDGSSNPIAVVSSGPTGSGVAAGDSIVLEVHATAPETGVCPPTWNTVVKQSNDLSGTPGNDFTGNSASTKVNGSDHFVWTTQPTDTEYDKDMTPSPAATLIDACGATVTTFSGQVTLTDSQGELSPTTTVVNASNGVATFPGVQFGDYGFTDTLMVDSTDTSTCSTGATCESDSFFVYQYLVTCSTNMNRTCSTPTLSGPAGETEASIVAGGATTPDVLTVYIKDAAVGTCGGTTSEPPLGEVVTFNVENRTKTVTMTLPKDYVNLIPNNGTPFMDICMDVGSSGTPFFDKRHYQDPSAYSDPVYVGLLPDCSDSGNTPPCVTSRKKNAGNEIITFVAPIGDPHTSWY